MHKIKQYGQFRAQLLQTTYPQGHQLLNQN